MNRHAHTGLRIVVTSLAIAAAAGAQIIAPISPSQTGPPFVNQVNQSFGISPERPTEPVFSCYPGPGFMPAAKLAKHFTCRGCAPTNPCSAGPYVLDALGVCDDDGTPTGTNCRWHCNQGTPPDLQQFFSVELGAPVSVSNSVTPVLSIVPVMGASATAGWLARYQATVTVTVAPSVTCDVSLNLDNDAAPVRVATVANDANADDLTTTVTLAAERVRNDVSTTVAVFAQASAGSGCTVVDAAGQLSGAVTRIDVTVVPK